jgi:hypothetical protein
MQFSPASYSQENLGLCPPFNVKVSHPNETTGKIVALCISMCMFLGRRPEDNIL